MHLAETLTFRIVDGSAFHLVGVVQTVGLVGCQAARGGGCRIIHLVTPVSRLSSQKIGELDAYCLDGRQALRGTGSALRRLFATAASPRSSATAPSALSAGSSARD